MSASKIGNIMGSESGVILQAAHSNDVGVFMTKALYSGYTDIHLLRAFEKFRQALRLVESRTLRLTECACCDIVMCVCVITL